jgi:hypothetical protein
LTSQPKPETKLFLFLDEIFLNSPLCQICEYAIWGMGDVCSLMLNRRVPSELVIQNSQIIFCGSHRNWIEEIDDIEN